MNYSTGHGRRQQKWRRTAALFASVLTISAFCLGSSAIGGEGDDRGIGGGMPFGGGGDGDWGIGHGNPFGGEGDGHGGVGHGTEIIGSGRENGHGETRVVETVVGAAGGIAQLVVAGVGGEERAIAPDELVAGTGAGGAGVEVVGGDLGLSLRCGGSEEANRG